MKKLVILLVILLCGTCEKIEPLYPIMGKWFGDYKLVKSTETSIAYYIDYSNWEYEFGQDWTLTIMGTDTSNCYQWEIIGYDSLQINNIKYQFYINNKNNTLLLEQELYFVILKK